ncbi:hypothetical protein ACQE3E_02865 [Methylomonas sp. MED-D]|uniref:Uncharacterized protein n=1 Tax=Methylomonas koyamae TaxID=702114 RepID=A0A177N318_9GAMM|nr:MULTISPECIES: hypothetical protein [Methylomonas]MDT4330152.1 hypothetical protein [Methylomonas sp. MV1]OAI11863.1 hypothetical protein A1355_15325 [Methylomonas koyamae]
MSTLRTLLFTGGLLLTAQAAQAREINVPVPMEYGLIRSVLVNQLYTGAGETARVWKDGKQCSFLDLSQPQIGGEDGLVKIENHVQAKIGTALGNKCMTIVEWSGILQTFQQPTLDSTGNVLSFPVTRTQAYDGNGQALNIDQLLSLIKKAAEPKLASLKIDLNRARPDIAKSLLPFISAEHSEDWHDAVNSLRFNQAKADAKGLLLGVGYTANDRKSDGIKSSPVLTETELAQWRQLWQNWQGSVEQAIERTKLTAADESAKATMREVLEKAGSAFEQGLTGEYVAENDPVRKFFNSSWDKLAPLLRLASTQLPGGENLRYVTLVAATDLMYELESIGSPLGLEVSSNGLRKLARSLIAQEFPKTKTKGKRKHQQ